ncbi:MAG: hypothetical protein B9J98_03530, partial [Candidatus Terraquivivens tikiterensis]
MYWVNSRTKSLNKSINENIATTGSLFLGVCMKNLRRSGRSFNPAIILLIGLLMLSSYTIAMPVFSATGADISSSGDGIRPGDISSSPEIVNSTSVTLITGDVVHIFYLRGGEVRIAIDPVDPSKTNRDFRVFKDRRGLYVIPDDVDLKRYDLNLFNVKLLAEQASITGMSDRMNVIVKGLNFEQVTAVVNFVKKAAQEQKLHHDARIIHPKLNLASLTLDMSDRKKVNEVFIGLPQFKKMWLDIVHRLSDIRFEGGVPNADGDPYGDNLETVGAPWVWTRAQATGDGVKIAILDTGIDFTHRDFKFMNGTSKIIAAKSFVDWPEEEVNDPTDYHGHGTHVSGIAAGTGLTMLNSSYLSPIAHPLIKRHGNDEAAIMAGNGTHLVVVWHSDVSGNLDIWGSIYNGKEWNGPVQLTTDRNLDEWPYVSILSNNRILLMWSSNRTGTWEIWYKVYINGRLTEDKQLTTYPGDHDYLPAFTELPNGTIALIWSSEAVNSNTSNVYFAKLTMASDGTLSFIGSVKPLTNAPANRWYYARSLLLTRSGELWAFWDDLSNFNFETYWGGITTMYYNASKDYGGSWNGTELYSGSGCAGPIGIELNNGTLMLLFEGDDYEHNINYETFYLKLLNGVIQGPYRLEKDVWGLWRASAAYGPGGLYIAGTHWTGDYYGNDIMIIPPKPVYMGVAPKALLLEGKVLNKYGWGYDSWIINGIYWAVSSGANIISMSLGGWPTNGEDPLSQAVNWAYDQGVVVTVAAGNMGNYFTITSPGSAEKAITVGAAETSTSIAWFSSRGPVMENFRVKPEIVAPGVGVCSSVPEYIYGHSYECWSGTSMATPHVAGALAILYHYANMMGYGYPQPWLARQWLLAFDTKDMGYDVYTQGAGLLNLMKGFVIDVNGKGGNNFWPPVINFGPIPTGTIVSQDIRICEYLNSRSYEFEVTAQNVVTGESRSIASITPSTISVSKGACGTVTLTISNTAPPGLYSGKILVKDSYGYTYNLIFGVFIGYNLTVHKISMEGPGNEQAVYGDVLAAFKLDPKSDLESMLGSPPYRFFNENGVATFLLPEGHYEIYTMGDWNGQPVFVAYDNLSLSGNTEITLDERRTYPVTFDPNKDGQVFAAVYHAIDSSWICPLNGGYCDRYYLSRLMYYPATAVAYYSNSSVMCAVDRYVYYPGNDVNPSDPSLISTKTWHDLFYAKKQISSPINRVANYNEVVTAYAEYRTAAAPRQAANRGSWVYNYEYSVDAVDFVWKMNIPYSRVEIISPNNWYEILYSKYRDLPGISTPYWGHYADLKGNPGEKMDLKLGNHPLVPGAYAGFSSYQGGNWTNFWGYAFSNPTILSWKKFQFRYDDQSLSVKVWKNGAEVKPDYTYIYGGAGFFYLYFSNVLDGTHFKVEVDASAYATLSTKTNMTFEAVVQGGSVIQSPMISEIDVQGSTLNNTVESSAVNVIFQLYNQSSIQSLTFEYSTDDGGTWTKAPVSAVGPNTYSASFACGGQQYVSIRINATDSNNLR